MLGFKKKIKKIYFNATGTLISEQSPAQCCLQSAGSASDAAEGNEDTLVTETPTFPAPSFFFFFYSSFTLNHEFTPPFGAGCWSPTKKKKIKGINELLPPNQGVPLASGRRTREHFKGPGSLSLGARAAPFLPQHPSWWQGEPKARVGLLALYGFQGTISACPSSGRVEKNLLPLLLRPCWAVKKHLVKSWMGRKGMGRISAPWKR